ncbi:MAG: hypothetical protein EXS31_16910 [Pedosphaera sp.]|nr:hypothetical protein [Pedosphaera sp.]
MSLPLSAAEKEAAAPAKGDAAPVAASLKSNHIPFHGKLGAVDAKAMTITIDGKEKKRVIHVAMHAKITKAGGAAKLEDAVVGEEVRGQLLKTDGKEEAISLRLGAKPEAKEKKATRKKEKK